MARVSRAQSDRNRQTIEAVSARLFREQGLRGVSVDDLMAAAGLTHGGFYGHFESKDALAAVACTQAFKQSASRWQERIQGKERPAALKAIVDAYLSKRSRDDPGNSCPVTALAGDVAREPADKPIHAAFTAGIKEQLAVLASLQGPETARDQALVQLSTLVGALLLARATSGDALSQRFLDAARDDLQRA
ncbi:MAG: TetR/AcrR family transcriptional regulator [Holophaga sp.]|nr:TetR/AcrR family transcriptional regulator [Holophaga sp.]